MVSLEKHLTYLSECCIGCYPNEMTEFHLVKHSDNFQQNLTL